MAKELVHENLPFFFFIEENDQVHCVGKSLSLLGTISLSKDVLKSSCL